MKKTLIALLVTFLVIGFAFTQTQKPITKVFNGTVDSVTLADQTKGVKAEIVVVGANNQKMTFLVNSTTKITAADEKPITLDKVQKGNKCEVTYSTTPENINEAILIHLLK